MARVIQPNRSRFLSPLSFFLVNVNIIKFIKKEEAGELTIVSFLPLIFCCFMT